MKSETYELLTDDSLKQSIERLEARGFYLYRTTFKSKAPRTHHKTREAQRRARALDPQRVETRRAYERRKQATFRGRWRHARRTYPEGFMSFEDWEALWRAAGNVQLGDGTEKPAWQMRGKGNAAFYGVGDKVQMRRWDVKGPYSLENVYVQWKDNVLADGAEIALRAKEIAEWEINKGTENT